MRRSHSLLLMALSVAVLGSASSLSAQATCYGNGCSIRVGVGTNVQVGTVVPSAVRVSIAARSDQSPAVALTANTPMVVIQRAPNQAADVDDQQAADQGTGPSAAGPDVPPGQPVVYTVVAR